MSHRIIVGITGASGSIYGIRLLEALREKHVETHLVMSKWARAAIHLETDYDTDHVRRLASVVYSENDQAAAISSGSYPVEAMVVVPCSMKTVASIRAGLAENLLTRSADVTLKERRPLILVPRESPLSAIHLENLLYLARLGVAIIPPMPAFYSKPESLDDIVDHTVSRVLDHLRIPNDLAKRWGPRGKPEDTDT